MLHVAWREFTSTVFTKAFLLGILLPPAIGGLMLILLPILMNQASPKVRGHIAVIDHTGKVGPKVADAFSAERYAKRTADKAAKELENLPAPQAVKDMANANAGAIAAAAAANAPTLTVRILPADADPEAVKDEIRKTGDKAKDAGDSDPCLALAVVPASALTPDADGTYGVYDLFVAPKLDVEVQKDMEAQFGRAIIDSRLEMSGLDVKKVRAMTDRVRIEAKSVTSTGEKRVNEVAKILIPGAFMFLLWIATFACGQQLLTSTIEEKSSRVMEVLLSAVSPMQLLTGKIVGQMSVGLLMLVMYGGLGIAALIYKNMGDMVVLLNLLYFALYFFIAFFTIASLMAAIGSAVSDIREAQNLLGPIMIVLIIPMMLWLPLLRNPNSTFAQIVSFIPPVSPFVMVLRISGSEPVPFWQIPATLLLGALSVLVCLWAAAKVFRIGVLMYGKPPNFRTLLRWVRMA
ncbi:MAG: ABC transporter permease [Phycisphaerae bacterium]|nr:ABC transporter permease [Phycisphaerae bacterium]